MITAKLNRKISLLPQESCKKEKGLVGQFLQVSVQAKKEMAFKAFMEKMDVMMGESLSYRMQDSVRPSIDIQE